MVSSVLKISPSKGSHRPYVKDERDGSHNNGKKAGGMLGGYHVTPTLPVTSGLGDLMPALTSVGTRRCRYVHKDADTRANTEKLQINILFEFLKSGEGGSVQNCMMNLL